MSFHSKKLLRLEAAIRSAASAACTPEFLRREFQSIQRIARNSEKPEFHQRITDRRVISKQAQHMARGSVGPSARHFQDAIKAKHQALREQGRLEQERQRLEEATLKDGLTGMFNRRFFDMEIQKTASLAARGSTGYGVIMVDGDKFKNVNDTYGHQAGDVVLREIANRLQAHERKHDYPCRYGGEEFAIILPDCLSLAAAVVVAERMRQTIEGKPFTLPDGQEIRITASFGVSVCRNPDRENVESVIKRADMALYAAKGKDIEGLLLSDEDKANSRNRVAYINSSGQLFINTPKHIGPALPVGVPAAANPSGTALG